MRALAVLLLFPAVAAAQTADTLAPLNYVLSLRDAATGGYRPTAAGKPELRSTSAAIRAIKALGGKLPDAEKTTAFVMGCLDATTGAFVEPGGKPEVSATAIGVLAAAELGVPKDRYRPALVYLGKHAKTFDEVRIAAAAVEVWGAADGLIDLEAWDKVVDAYGQNLPGTPRDGGAREVGSVAAYWLRLNRPFPAREVVPAFLQSGQLADGGWGKTADASDLEATYRVMRAMMLLKAKPDAAGLRGFVASCRNPDGGYGVAPKLPSSVSGTYYAATVLKWLEAAK
jgi:hypothetical protein